MKIWRHNLDGCMFFNPVVYMLGWKAQKRQREVWLLHSKPKATRVIVFDVWRQALNSLYPVLSLPLKHPNLGSCLYPGGQYSQIGLWSSTLHGVFSGQLAVSHGFSHLKALHAWSVGQPWSRKHIESEGLQFFKQMHVGLWFNTSHPLSAGQGDSIVAVHGFWHAWSMQALLFGHWLSLVHSDRSGAHEISPLSFTINPFLHTHVGLW